MQPENVGKKGHFTGVSGSSLMKIFGNFSGFCELCGISQFF
jgi:hypothetical protein